MHPKVVQTLSSRILRCTLLCALGLGLLISTVQIALDYKQVKRLPDQDMMSLVNIILDPAAAIVFSLDIEQAEQLLKGVLSQPAVTACRIKLENGAVFAEHSKPLYATGYRELNDILFGNTRQYSWSIISPLASSSMQNIGTLEIELDTYTYGRVFLERAFISMAGSLSYALILTGMLLAVFYLLVTKPLSSVIDSISLLSNQSEKARLQQPKGHSNSEIGLLVQLTNQRLETIDNTLEQLRDAKLQLKHYSDGLEETVKARTQELRNSLKQLEEARDQLIQSEKMAALGGLVAGIAHEVNTPLGIAVTAASVISEALSEIKLQFDNKTLTSDYFAEMLEHIQKSNEMLVNNIDRAANLIRDFKKTAVDQISETRCEFELYSTLSALITSLHPETRKIPVDPILDCPQDLHINSLPGVLTQILANLILNSVRHAFVDVVKPQIQITVQQQDEHIVLNYRDNGIGVPIELHQKIFEPFFTSKRGQGGSGLGLNIVYNLVTRKLGGHLEFESSPGNGVEFKLRFPRQLNSDLMPPR